MTLGLQVLKSRGFFTHAYWYWIGVGALIGFIFLTNFLYTLFLTYLDCEYLYIWLFIKTLIMMMQYVTKIYLYIYMFFLSI
jgi:hypothetical protein